MLRLKNYKTPTSSVSYFRHIYCPRQLKIAARINNANCRLQLRTSLTNLCFLELCNVFRRSLRAPFSPIFVPTALVLNERLCKDRLSIFAPLLNIQLIMLSSLYIRTHLTFSTSASLSSHSSTYNGYACNVQVCCYQLQTQSMNAAKAGGY